jgi:hypothetical protein
MRRLRVRVRSECDRVHTVVDLLQCHHGVGRQALLSILIQQEGLRSDRTLLWRQHGGVLRGGVHGGHGGSGGIVRARRAHRQTRAEQQQLQRSGAVR